VWAEYQLADSTPAPIFDGLGAVIARLADVPQGIVSQNARAHIIERLVEADLRRYFKAIVGYQELPPGTQKPDPDGLLICLEALTSFGPGTALYIGDHESDVLCAARTNEVLADRGIDLRIKTVGVFFADGSTNASWTHNPDDRARCPGEILTIAEGFPGSSISVIREANDIIEPKM
jgi:phosphoglycolate phosphatase-like HAD superfamily hydrolase